jgi:hypothetical protein
MDRSLARGEIISELQHLPYHSQRAYALRIALTLLEDLKNGNDQGIDHRNNDH